MFLDAGRRTIPAPTCIYDPSHYVLQCLDYLDNIDIYKDRIKMFHVKDAEFNPTGRQGVYGGYQGWVNRAGRFRSLGDGQVDFGGDFFQDGSRTISTAGPLSNGNAALKHPGRRRPLKERNFVRASYHSRDGEGVRRLCLRWHG